MTEPPLYDRIGDGYPATRQPDPRIAEAIERGLGAARTVLNVGAGTGSYEPRDREVTAVEPSAAMIAQRSAGSAKAIQAPAEELPFPDRSFDAAMAVMTVHHWSDLERGLSELRRVARDRVVIFTWDPGTAGEGWLARDYLPELTELDVFRFAPPHEIARALGGAQVEPFPLPRDCRDGFIEAWWARPEAYLDPVVRAGCSGFRALDPAAVERATQSLSRDLDSGEWDNRHGALRSLRSLDLGNRLVVADLTRGPSAGP